MNDPVLLGGIALILGALFIGFKLAAPGLKSKGQNSQSAQGFNEARARVVEVHFANHREPLR